MYYRKWSKIKFDDVYNYLELIKNDDLKTEDTKSIAEYAQELISDSRLKFYPCIDLTTNGHIQFLYEGDEEKIDSENHLVIKIHMPGNDYDDKVIEYFYSHLGQYADGKNASWNDILPVINKWHKNSN